jgi:hypothetical protein
MMMEHWSRQLDSAKKWWLVVPALMVFSFSLAPGFLLGTAHSQNQPSATPSPAAQAPDQKTALDGTWQGTLHAGQDLRIEVSLWRIHP